MEMTDRHLIIMRPDGKFDRISRKKRSCEVGEEIVYTEDSGINWRSPSIAGRSAIAAAVVFCLVLFASFNGKLGSPEVVAYITMDINPSVEIGIDIEETVLELRGLNEDGMALVQGIDYKGKSLVQVTEGLLDEAEQGPLASGEADIVIASTVVASGTKMSDEAIVDKVKQQVTKHIKTTHPQQTERYQVTAIAAPKEIREAASQNDVSAGKYAMYLHAKSNGADVTLEELKKTSVMSVVKNKPEVAELIKQEPMPSKVDLKKLVEEEKSGELDKKIAEKKSSSSNSKSSTSSKTGSTTSSGNSGSKSTSTSSKPGQTDSKEKDDDKDDKDDDRKTNSSAKPGSTTGTTSGGSTKTDPKKPSTGNSNDRDDDDKDDDDKKNSTGNSKASPSEQKPGSSKPGTSSSGGNGKDDDDDDKKPATNNGKQSESSKKEEERKREEEKRLEELRKQAEEKKQQLEEESRKKQEDARKKQEEERKKQEEARKKQEEERKKQEEARKKQEQQKKDDD